MLTVDSIKKASGMYKIPKYVHINKNVCFDYRLFDALVRPNHDGDNRDYKYDFDVFLPKYGVNLQRPYVWEEVQQREFILSLLQEKPLDSVIIVQHNSDRERKNTINYVIDGKQRLMTIQKFANNEFPILIDGEKYYFKDFDDDLKVFLRSRVNYITGTVYYSYDNAPITDDMKITLFNFYNFSGTPQTEEHKQKLQSLINNEL